jgi:hypothetical protein
MIDRDHTIGDRIPDPAMAPLQVKKSDAEQATHGQ